MSSEKFHISPTPASEVIAAREKLQLEKEVAALSELLADVQKKLEVTTDEAEEKIAHRNPDKPLHQVHNEPRQWIGPGPLL